MRLLRHGSRTRVAEMGSSFKGGTRGLQHLAECTCSGTVQSPLAR